MAGQDNPASGMEEYLRTANGMVNRIKGGIREGKMLRDSQDFLDVTLVCGNDDGWRDKRILLQGDWRRV